MNFVANLLLITEMNLKINCLMKMEQWYGIKQNSSSSLRSSSECNDQNRSNIQKTFFLFLENEAARPWKGNESGSQCFQFSASGCTQSIVSGGLHVAALALRGVFFF